MERDLAAIILAAGLGTRMRSGRAKVLHEVAGDPMIVRVLRTFIKLQPNPLVTVVGYQATEVESVSRQSFSQADLRFAPQQKQRGTGDAARCGFDSIPADFKGDVLIAYGDMPRLRAESLRNLVRQHRESAAALSFISVALDEPGAYGRVVRDHSGAVQQIIEARDANPSQLAITEINTGVYVATADFLRTGLAELRPANVQREYYLTDLVGIACQRGLRVEAWRADAPEQYAGVNSREDIATMEALIREEVNRKLMAAGVTLMDPATAYIGEEVEIGVDTVIGPNVQILGRSRIGSGVRIEGTAWLRDVTVGERSFIKLGVRAEECRVGDDCEVGPFANLRAGTILEGRNKIGNFVETKKARVGRGSQAKHLSYLGDVQIGSETNVGCGVITVNYDGYDKHLTQIGDRCMVGCDTQLVAPVKIGDDVYVASGTTILRDVADGALVMSHHPQREKPGWTEQWHERHRDHPHYKGRNAQRGGK